MTRTSRVGNMAVAYSAVAATLLLTTACAVLHKGDVQPDAVEKKAHTISEQTLTAVNPVIGVPKTKMFADGWTRCATETPGQHRFDYDYALRISVPHDKIKAALDATRAEYRRRGYRLDYVPNPDRGISAGVPKSTWNINLSVDKPTSFLLSIDSDCVPTRHDPKT